MIVQQLKSECLSVRALLQETLANLKKIPEAMKMTVAQMEPSAMDILKETVKALVKSGEEAADTLVKKQTGYTIQELRYKTIEGYRTYKEYQKKYKEYNQKLKNYKKNKDNITSEVKAQAETELQQYNSETLKLKEIFSDWLKKQSDAIYNAFAIAQIKEIFEETKSLYETWKDSSIDAIEELEKQVDDIKEFFGKGITTNNVKDVSLNDNNIITNISDRTSTAEQLLAKMSRSAATTLGNDVQDFSNKKTVEVVKTLITILTSLITSLDLFKALLQNYQTNKHGLKADASKKIADTNKDVALKANVTIPVTVYFDPSTGKRYSDSSYGEDILDTAETVFYVPDSSTAYISFESIIPSELRRMRKALNIALKDAHYDEEYPLVSKSTIESGGKVKNLKYAGYTESDLIDAVNNINEGIRLSNE